MSIDGSLAYERSGCVLWRDTGRHIVARSLAGSVRPETSLLMGGSVLLWRLLGTPRRFHELLAELGADGKGPTEKEVASALADLAGSGLVTSVTEAG